MSTMTVISFWCKVFLKYNNSVLGSFQEDSSYTLCARFYPSRTVNLQILGVRFLSLSVKFLSSMTVQTFGERFFPE